MANMFALILVDCHTGDGHLALWINSFRHLNGGNVRQRRRRLPVTH